MKLKKILVMKTRPGISDQEIQSMMDFNKVLDVHRSTRKKSRLLWTTGVVGGGIVVGLILWQVMMTPPSETPMAVEQPQPPVVEDSTSVPDKKIDAIEELETKPNEPNVPKKDELQPVVKQEPAQPVETTQAYTEAEPVNGYPDLYAYFHQELKYPVEALKDSVEGIVSVSFVINKDGKPEQVKILNSLGKAFDDEALRVIGAMPQWKAASLNGKPVPARISMPLTFQVDKIQKQ